MSRLPSNASTSASAADPYDADRPLMLRCACGQDHAPQAHATAAAASLEEASRDFVEATLVKALFPQEAVRRRFLKAVGAGTARAAIASLLPVASLQAMAQERGSLEKKDLKIGFIAITCATPLIMADPLGFYKKEGLNVQLNKTAGWALIRDKMLNKEHDASHFLSPMPLAISMGLGSTQVPMNVATIQNTNGQAITLHVRHKDKRDPKQWKGMKFAVPFEYSMHNFLLRYYLAEHGVNPDTDVQIRVTPPPEMVANLRAGNIDGFLGPDPFNQRAVYDEVGFIHILSKEIWDGHPCCAFGISEAFIQQNPNTFAALYRAVITASYMASMPKDRELIAKVISPTQYLNQPETVVAQVLTGKFADGLGAVKNVPDRANFDPVPWQSMAVWMLTQMKRWGYVKGDVNYRQIAEKVFMLTDAKKQMAAAGWRPPEGAYRKFKVMGKEFDPARPEAYANSFAISKAAG
ncbi:CmpA/NrtA family ABC transporter substrate-binding protein [Xenophilus arseniciresistens]|uniref:CmpA/NrtA family ABC transporter substrate-binding protein n=1 Tax=Xenophilus arseniciresistens TaxID=1283306 RepID=A0AAE3T1F7_9BURK|nr:CmpA/NrtA family ABC transporter substrate-binding protein [Xenophilus arseniciresistens]MDA7417322.1 CmpA/NrtA family ABC transporter substrate-binding protein [Xenophilus arseniciresistens]